MNGIVALARFDGPPAEPGSLRPALEAMRHRATHAPWSAADGPVALAMIDGLRVASLRTGRDPDRHPRVIVAADARLDVSEELRRELDLPADAAAVECVAASYARFGDACVARLQGEFAFVLWDPVRRRLLCARDRFGVKPLYYRLDESGGFACASEIGAVLALAKRPVALREARLVSHLETTFEEGCGTFYESIVRLPPAHFLVFDGRSARIEAYWSLQAPPLLRLRTRSEYEEAFRTRLAEAVARQLRGTARAGSMLSGGLDSSAIVAFARRSLADGGRPPLRTLSLVFDGRPEQNERRFVEPVVAQGFVEASYVDASAIDPIGDAIAESAGADEPLAGGNFCLNRAMYARARQLGVDVLLDGTDGDTVVSHGIGRFAELFARGHWWSLWTEAQALATVMQRPTSHTIRRLAVDPVLRKLAHRTPRLLTLVRWLRGTARAPRSGSLLRPEVARRFGLDVPRASGDGFEAALDRYSSEQELHVRSVQSPIHAFVFEQFDRLAAASGIEPRYPMFDLPFVEFCLSLPAAEKLAAGWTRRTMRGAMEKLLPREVAWRREKSDFSQGFVKAIRAYVSLPGSAPEKEWLDVLGDYVDPDALRSIVDRLRYSPTVPDALATWKVLTLSLWLKVRTASQKTETP